MLLILQTFPGNWERYLYFTNWLEREIVADSLRLFPFSAYNDYSGLRLEVLGCPLTSPAPPLGKTHLQLWLRYHYPLEHRSCYIKQDCKRNNLKCMYLGVAKFRVI